jgi:hypothetical protein
VQKQEYKTIEENPSQAPPGTKNKPLSRKTDCQEKKKNKTKNLKAGKNPACF